MTHDDETRAECTTTCDWCGELLAPGESILAGYADQPTHKHCAGEARLAYLKDQNLRNGGMGEREEREPFTDWPIVAGPSI